MVKFKAGDRVRRVCGSHNGMMRGFEDVVVEVRMFDYDTTLTLLGYGNGHDASKFELLHEPALPPAPTVVKYNEGHGNTLEVRSLPANKQYSARIRIGLGGMTGLCAVLEPDDALNLCHDLRRMAMEIKRQEKKDG